MTIQEKLVTTVKTVEVLLHRTINWYQINWYKAHRIVSRLQARIVKATQTGKWRLVKKLQRLLTHAFSAKVLAVRKVTENRGRKTAGVDGVTWDTPGAKSLAVMNLKKRGYKAQPLRRVYIPKSDGKRPLGIPTMRDRAMQALHLLALEPVAETTGDLNSYGFRRERCCADALSYCYNLLAKKGSGQWILEGDIRACFDEIDHLWLENNIPMDKGILRKWLKAGYVESKKLYPTKKGTPQGGVASPCLANLALDGMESLLDQEFHSNRKESRLKKVYFVRYADDFIVTSASREVLEVEVKPMLEKFLAERGLELSVKKTRIVHIEEGFDFLGQNVRKYKGKFLLKPSKKSQKGLLKKVKEVLKKYKGASQKVVILKLNPILRGWANYHKHVVSKQVFSLLDNKIWRYLWQWLKRQRRNKNSEGESQNGFMEVNGVSRFGVNVEKESGRKMFLLYKLSETPIERHIQIQARRNPYTLEGQEYFQNRRKHQMKKKLLGNGKRSAVYREQKGVCCGCKQTFGVEDEVDFHHIIYRKDGGNETVENLQMMHLTCHKQTHAP
jgi:RNA-directed DNA polymerase